MPVPALQVKTLPDDLHARLQSRARQDGVTITEYVTRLLRRDLERPTIKEWLEAHPAAASPRPIDVAAALDDARIEYDVSSTATRSADAG